MDVRFDWNVKDERILSRGFELMGEFNEGEQHVIIKRCFKVQRELERGQTFRESTSCIIAYGEKGFDQNSIDFVHSCLLSGTAPFGKEFSSRRFKFGGELRKIR